MKNSGTSSDLSTDSGLGVGLDSGLGVGLDSGLGGSGSTLADSVSNFYDSCYDGKQRS